MMTDRSPFGERRTLGRITVDSTIPCGAGHAFETAAPDHLRCRSRIGDAPYAWRLYVRIDSPGDGRDLLLDACDFNHGGRQRWQEQAASVSHDNRTWHDLGLDRIRIVPWTPDECRDSAYGDAEHVPYGVQFRIKLDAPTVWFATPPPYTLADRDATLSMLQSDFPDRVTIFDAGPSHHSHATGERLRGVQLSSRDRSEPRLRCMIIAGEHAAEFAGMWACDEILRRAVRDGDLLQSVQFVVVPLVNVDGVAYGRTYHNHWLGDDRTRGVNLSRDWAALSQPETRAVMRLVEMARPDVFLSLHNGRHRREWDLFAHDDAPLQTLLRHWRHHLPLPFGRLREPPPGCSVHELRRRGLATVPVLFETLLLQTLPGVEDRVASWRLFGAHILAGLRAALGEMRDRGVLTPRPPLQRDLAPAAPPASWQPLTANAADFSVRLPLFYGPYGQHRPFDKDWGRQRQRFWNLEINALPISVQRADVRLETSQAGAVLDISHGGDRAVPYEVGPDGAVHLRDIPLQNRMLRLDVFAARSPAAANPVSRLVLAPPGADLRAAASTAAPFTDYRRQTHIDDLDFWQQWPRIHAKLQAPAMGTDDLQEMVDDLLDWMRRRQILDENDPHVGGILSEEDKIDFRDAAAAAVCFMHAYRRTGDSEWKDRARRAVRHARRGQVTEERAAPSNTAKFGGFVHMISGAWGTDFRRLAQPWPPVDGVDTCIILTLLVKAYELGLEWDAEDERTLRRAADWIIHNELAPGIFAHHEGATHDCQNSNALAAAALLRVGHFLRAAGLAADPRWFDAADRAICHVLEGQESIGVWPYVFATVGRGQAFHEQNLPDQGMGLIHLLTACDYPPYRDDPNVQRVLKRSARWYLCVSRIAEPTGTLDLAYDESAEGLCFSSFTWCRFTAAASLVRIAQLAAEPQPWTNLALALMEHVREALWNHADPERAPVRASAHPHLTLHSWIQAAEWDAVLLHDILDRLKTVPQSDTGTRLCR